MPADPITALTDKRSLKKIVDGRIKGRTGLTKMLFGRTDILTEENAQVDVREGTSGLAPFVTIGQKAALVGADNGRSYTITTPFINIKRPVTWSTKLAKRLAGQSVFTKVATTLTAIREAMTKDIDKMNDLIDNRLEWMASKALTGQIDYSVEGNASFQINYGKPAANTFTVPVLWDAGSGVLPLEDVTSVKKVINKTRGPVPNVAIGGENAGAALRNLIETEQIKVVKTTSGVEAVANATLKADIEDDGMLFIANVGGVDFFEYTGVYTNDSGNEESFIRSDYFEFFSTSTRANDDRELLFGSMPDIKIILAGEDVTERHYTVKQPEDDQGTMEGIMKSRPLPWLYRPDHMVSLKVT